MPKDPVQRSRMRIWIDFCNTRLQQAGGDVVHGNNPDKAGEKLKEHLNTLNREMLHREYISGDYSLADITYIPFFVRRERYKVSIDESLPQLKGWMDRPLNRAVVRSTP